MTVAEIRHTVRQSRLARWQWLRRLGRGRFILLYGVIGAGLPMFLMFTFVFPLPPITFSIDLRTALIIACICFPGGAWIGWSEWRRSEERYIESVAEETNAQGLTNR